MTERILILCAVVATSLVNGVWSWRLMKWSMRLTNWATSLGRLQRSLMTRELAFAPRGIRQ
jgi:hypothetical protein